MARKESVAKIAKSLKRTVGATRQKATVIGLSLSLTPKKRTVAKKPTAARKPTVAMKQTPARKQTAARKRPVARKR
jgi:hypothetical protein